MQSWLLLSSLKGTKCGGFSGKQGGKDFPFMFHMLWFSFLLISAKDNSGKCWPCLWVAQGEGEIKTEQILHPAIRPSPGTTTMVLKSKACAYNWGFFFYATNSSIYSVRLPLPSVVCAFSFFNNPKERVFLLFKGVTEFKSMVRR